MKLCELNLIKESLRELTPDVETFNWGPSYEMAQERKRVALGIVNREIKARRVVTWKGRSIQSMDSSHIRATIKMLQGWAIDRHQRGGMVSKLYDGFTIQETILALKRELNNRY